MQGVNRWCCVFLEAPEQLLALSSWAGRDSPGTPRNGCSLSLLGHLLQTGGQAQAGAPQAAAPLQRGDIPAELLSRDKATGG